MARSHRIVIVFDGHRYHARCTDCDWKHSSRYWAGELDLPDHLGETLERLR